MAKFMVLYSSTNKAGEVMANTTPEELKASMDEWLAWREEAKKTVTAVDFGLPLQAISRLSYEGITESSNPASGYSIVEEDSKEALVDVLKKHPHLKRSSESIDVFEMLPMPGVQPKTQVIIN